jgi:hypothetical protein
VTVILIPASVLILDDYYFPNCESFSLVAFENETQLEEITMSNFDRNLLALIVVPASAAIRRSLRFARRAKFEEKDIKSSTALLIVLYSDSRMERTERSVFA